ncbi:MAG: glycosyltransferase [Pseudonocardia sp.]|nr:glycosyltransferase [Pseudonocardia sp.]
MRSVRDVGAVAVAVGSVVRAAHCIMEARGMPRLSPPAPPLATQPPPVTVIVPARDEEAVLDGCLAGLRAQTHAPLSVLLVDDGSTDATGAIARRHAEADHRVTVVSIDGPPPGWLGKVHAMHAGVRAAGPAAPGEWLLFLDADTLAAPDLVSRMLATAADHDLELLSIHGGPPAGAGLVWSLLMPPGAQLISENASPRGRAGRRRALAIGHCILVRRTYFDKVGGWETLSARGNEDIALATAVRDAGGGTRFTRPGTSLVTRGIDPFPAGWASFRKSFTIGVGRSVPLLAAAGVAHVAFGLTPPAAVVSGLRRRSPQLVAAGVVGWAAQAAGHLQATRVTGGPAVSAVLAPASWMLAGGLFLDASRLARRGVLRWKGRELGSARGSG